MKILMMSKNGDGLGIAQKMQEEGNDVKVFIKERGFDLPGVGIVDRITSWRPLASDWADLVIADMVGFGKLQSVMDKFDVLHFGFSEIADLMELDRIKQMQLLKRVGIPLPETHEIDNPSGALDLLDMWDQTHPGFVIKPSGNLDTGKTFLCETIDTYKWALEQFSGDQDLVIQRIVKGVEISTEGWFDGTKWLEPFNHTFEEKRFLGPEVGPNTGCMGNLVSLISDPGSDKMVKELKKLTPFLSAAKYVGPIDLNAIVNKHGVFGLELTTRLGYDAIEALYELMEEPLATTIVSVVAGAKKRLEMKDGELAIAARLTVPPFPHRKADKRDAGLPVDLPSKTEGRWPHYFFTDVYKDKGKLKWAATDGVLMKVAAAGKSVRVAKQLLQQRIDKVKVLDLQYRTDIGDRFEEDMKRLVEFGALKEG